MNTKDILGKEIQLLEEIRDSYKTKACKIQDRIDDLLHVYYVLESLSKERE